jgi:hypothetical protein
MTTDYEKTSVDTKRLREKAVSGLQTGHTEYSVAASLIRIGDLLWQIKEDLRAVRGGAE